MTHILAKTFPIFILFNQADAILLKITLIPKKLVAYKVFLPAFSGKKIGAYVTKL